MYQKKLKFLIAYGPTQEPLDPVRYISNNSTGTMGRRLVEAAQKLGHTVTAVECPRDARTALDLLSLLRKKIKSQDVFIMTAAVCDVRPAKFSSLKIKKDKLEALALVKNPDILATLAKLKKKSQVFIGFALESENFEANAQKKLKNKSLEVIVLQKVKKNSAPFGNVSIDALFISKNGEKKNFSSVTKEKLAREIVSLGVKSFEDKTRD